MIERSPEAEDRSEIRRESVPMLDGYRFLELRGRGAQAETWSALNADGKRVAVKVHDIRRFDSWKDDELVRREAETLRHLTLPGVPRYYDFAEEGGRYYTIMEYIEGRSLRELTDAGYRCTVEEFERILRSLLRTLKHMHGRLPPLVHRDIKPANIMLDGRGEPWLVDFGVLSGGMSDGMTIVGTVGYMAPESFMGRTDALSDVYSLGVTLLHFITGRAPGAFEMAGDVLDFESSLPHDFPPKLRECLRRMLAWRNRSSAAALLAFLNASESSGVGSQSFSEDFSGARAGSAQASNFGKDEKIDAVPATDAAKTGGALARNVFAILAGVAALFYTKGRAIFLLIFSIFFVFLLRFLLQKKK